MGPFDSVRLPGSTGRIRLFAVVVSIAALAVTGTVLAAPDTGQGAVSVTASSAESVRFRIEDRDPAWTPVSGPGESRFRLSIPGFLTTGEPGHPATPRTGGWIVVPPGTRPELVVVSEEWSDAGGRLLAVEAIPVILVGDDPLDRAAGAVTVLPGEPIPDDLAIPEAALPSLDTRGSARTGRAASLGKVTWWRGRRIVSYDVNAARHDAMGRATQVLRSGEWEIRFVADRAAPTPPGVHARKTTGRGDDRFEGLFINPGLIDTQPTEAAWRGVAPDDPARGSKGKPEKLGTLLGSEARLAVWRTGLVRVTYARLRERGFLPEGTIQEDQIRLYQRRYVPRLDDGSGQPPYAEIEVPIHMVGDGDAFDGDDFFVFYGLRLRDDGEFTADLGAGPETIPGCGDQNEWNNEANFYWLAASEPETGQSWSRMGTQSIDPATLTPLTRYRRQDHYEEQRGFRENVPAINPLIPSETADRLYYNFYRDSEVSAGMNPLWSPDPAGADVQITLGYAGFSNFDRTVGLELVVDDNPATSLGNLTVATYYDSTRTFTVPAADLDGLNGKIRFFNPTQGALLFSFLNWVRISYDARYQAVGDRLEFHGGTDAGPRPMEVTGLTTDDVGVFEITDPRQPVFVSLGAGNLVADGAAWKISIQPNQSGATRRFAVEGDFTTDGVPEFPFHLSQVADDPSDPTQLTGTAPDLVVVTHGDFRGSLDRWLEHRAQRAGGDLAYHVVDVQDLYDWYSGGLRGDRALKRFTTHAMTRWGSWALAIVGDANENVLGKGVLASARAWSEDWVPTHYHSQRALSLNPELMATDKWYATLESGAEGEADRFPLDVEGPWGMYTGRLPCNSVDELDRMIDKIMVVDNVLDGQDWRKRAILIADDQWSNGYGTGALTELVYSVGEEVFSKSLEDSLAPMWRDATGVTLEDDLLKLQTYLDPLYPYELPNPPARPLYDVREDAEVVAMPPLLSALNKGGTLALYQGHANPYLLASEVWFEDNPVPLTRRDVGLLSNTDKPWLFIGLGCHIADWAQSAYRSETIANEPSLCEKFVVRGGSGASASYGSSGYEYIAENRLFGEYILRRWTRNPLTSGLGSADPVRSRWIAGELMWASEADIRAVRGDRLVREMVAQYVLLGDPLMALDAGGPQVTATLLGDPDQEISGEADLIAVDATSTRIVEIAAGDEAGIDRLRVTDSSGMDLTDQVAVETLPPGATTHQRVDYTLTVPIQPYDHYLEVEIWDTAGALATDRHYTLTLNMPQEALFLSEGEVIDPETFTFPVDTPVEFSTRVSSSAWLDEGMERLLTSATLAITDTVWTLDKSLGLTVEFTAQVPTGSTADEHSVVLSLDGYETEWILQQGEGTVPPADIGQVYNFPNPMTESTRFVFESGAAGVDGVIRVFSTAGRTVAHIPFHYGGGGQGVVEWDGRDDAGDEMANGTYLYRVELETPQGMVASGMQRLVMMK